jgi:hypothetical protein
MGDVDYKIERKKLWFLFPSHKKKQISQDSWSTLLSEIRQYNYQAKDLISLIDSALRIK